MLTRNVNGKRVEMTLEEEADTRAEWAENEREAVEEAAKEPEPNMKERLDAMQAEIDQLKGLK